MAYRLYIVLFSAVIFFISSLYPSHAKTITNQQNETSSNPVVENFRLLDHLGESHELYYYSDYEAVVLFWQGGGCPIVRQSLPYLRDLRDKYKDRVKFLMINANPQDDRKAMLEEAQEFSIDMPILKDSTQLITEALNVKRTGAFIVIDTKTWTKAYQGPMDDRFGYESQRTNVKHNFVEDAIKSVLNKENKEFENQIVKGCLINLKGLYEEEKYTYVDDVAPILVKKCLQCHSPGGAAPFSMDHYENIKGWGSMIREVVRTKRMPPWKPDPHYGEFRNDIALTPEETRKIVKWIENGLIRGEGADPLETAKKPEHHRWELGEPDIKIYCEGEELIPAQGVLPYRFCESVNAIEEDVWIRAVDLRPRNLKVVHHMQAFRWEPGVVYDGNYHPRHTFKGPHGGNYFAGYLPGKKPYKFEDGVGMFFKKGTRVIFELHYVPQGRAEQDKPELGLYVFNGNPEKELSIRFIVDNKFVIPKNTKDFKLSKSYTFDNEVLIYAIRPHMHLRGKSARFIAEYPDGSSEILLSVPDYRFNWQHQYVFENPKKLPAKTKLTLEGVFDNSNQNPNQIDPSKDTPAGNQTFEEMFVGIVHYSLN